MLLVVRTGCGISATTVWYLYIIANPISLRYNFIQQQKAIYEEQKECKILFRSTSANSV